MGKADEQDARRQVRSEGADSIKYHQGAIRTSGGEREDELCM
jgi:hypothetical protein